MIITIAIREIQGGCALEQMTNIKLFSHGNTAVDLYRLLTNAFDGFPDTALRCSHGFSLLNGRIVTVQSHRRHDHD